MTQVVIQPSYGNAETRRHWADTLDRPVPFRAARYAGVLTAGQLARLDATHPGGTARFWGATARHDRRMDRLRTGDVVLLTGRKHVLAVGEVGVGLRHPELARRLWDPDPARCLWSNVYSLRAFHPVWIPYAAIWALPGFTAGDNFMGLRLLDPGKGAAVLAGLDLPGLLAAPAGTHPLARSLALSLSSCAVSEAATAVRAVATSRVALGANTSPAVRALAIHTPRQNGQVSSSPTA